MKYLISLALIAMLFVMVSGFIGADVDQSTSVTVLSDLTLLPTPNPLLFGTLYPGINSVQSVTLTPGNSSLSVSVNITGDPLMQSIEADFGTGYVLYSGQNIILMNNSPITFNTRLSIPSGTKQGTYNGIIVYSVMEAV